MTPHVDCSRHETIVAMFSSQCLEVEV